MAIFYAKEIQASTADRQRPGVLQMASDLGYCWVQGSNEYWYRSFLQYDLSSIPYKSRIVSAKLRVFDLWHNDNAASGTTDIARITEEWSQSDVSWDTMPASTGAYLAESVSPPGVNNWTDWDITSLVQEWVDRIYPNHGLMIVNNNEGAYRVDWRFYNRHYARGQYATYIEIEYEPEEEYRISRARTEELASEIRTISGSEGAMKPSAMVSHLSTANANVTSEAELIAQIASALEGKSTGGSGSLALNIAYGDTAPEDTTKLWVKSDKPNTVTLRTDILVEESIRTSASTLPAEMWDIGSATVGTKIYLFGGNANNKFNTIQAFDTLTETIETLSAVLPTAAGNITCAAVGTKIYLFGGYTSGALDTINVFDTETETITTLATKMPSIVGAMGCVSVGTKIYLFGGGASSKYSSIRVFDTETETITTLSAALPTGIASMGCTSVGTKIYLFGGYTNSAKTDAISIFYTDTETIRTVSTTLPAQCAGMGCMSIGNKIYLFGGDGLGNQIIAFDTETESISVLSATLPGNASALATGKVGNKCYLFGGWGSNAYAIYEFTVTIPLDNGTLALQTGNRGRVFKAICTPQVDMDIGVIAAYLGNSSDTADTVDAFIFDTELNVWSPV